MACVNSAERYASIRSGVLVCIPPGGASMRRLPRANWLLLAFAVWLSGCERMHPTPSTRVAESEPVLIVPEATTHHFGAVSSFSARTMTHRYRLSNAGHHEIKIVQLVNRKPCCGAVRVERTVLRPGDSADVEVKLA